MPAGKDAKAKKASKTEIHMPFKNFVFRERTQFQLRGEFYNAFNHVQWSTINSAAKFNAAGQQINTLFGTADSRSRALAVIQLALRFSF